jgi:thiol-disulfide isomerase/thioredoxin
MLASPLAASFSSGVGKRPRSPDATVPTREPEVSDLPRSKPAPDFVEISAASSQKKNTRSPSPNCNKERAQPPAEPEPPRGIVAAGKHMWQPKVHWPSSGVVNPYLHNRFVESLEQLATLLCTIPADRTRVFIAVAPWAVKSWRACLGDLDQQAALARDACVDAYFVDVDGMPDATELLEISTSQLPSAHSFHAEPKVGSAELSIVKRLQKSLVSPIDLTSLLCIEPVHGLAHLHRRMLRLKQNLPGNCRTGYLVAYSGATWCPPCCRIMPHVATLIRDLSSAQSSNGIHVNVVKLDRDAVGAVDALYDVKLIPTFQIFTVADVTREMCDQPAMINFPGAIPPSVEEGDTTSAAALEWQALLDRMRLIVLKPLAALQNSQVPTVKAFFERHCASLTFDDDF